VNFTEIKTCSELSPYLYKLALLLFVLISNLTCSKLKLEKGIVTSAAFVKKMDIILKYNKKSES